MTVPADVSKEDAIKAGKEAVADKTDRNNRKRNLRSGKNHKYCAEVSRANRNKTGLPMLA